MNYLKKILVLAPYKKEILKALGDSKLNLNKNTKIILIGSKRMIYDLLVENKISFFFDIIDVTGEIEICLYAKSIMKTQNVDFIVFGEIPEAFYYKVFESKINIDSYININVIENNNRLKLAICNNTNVINSFDRLNGLRITKNFMGLLNIVKIKATFVYPKINDYLQEAKINLLLSSDLKFDEISINCTKEILEPDYFEKENFNLLIFNSSDTLNNYVDFIEIMEKPKIAHVIIYNDNEIYAIDCLKESKYECLRFSFNLVNRLINKALNQKAS